MTQIQNNPLLDPKEFCYWLQGFFEISESKTLSEKQIEVIKEHLNLVFNKVTATTSTTYQVPENPTFEDISDMDRALEEFKRKQDEERTVIIC